MVSTRLELRGESQVVVARRTPVLRFERAAFPFRLQFRSPAHTAGCERRGSRWVAAYRLARPVIGRERDMDGVVLRSDSIEPSYTGMLSGDSVIVVVHRIVV